MDPHNKESSMDLPNTESSMDLLRESIMHLRETSMEDTTENRRTSEEAMERSMLMDPEDSEKITIPEAEMKDMILEEVALQEEATEEATLHPNQ